MSAIASIFKSSVLMLASAGLALADAPKRVVSVNICTDLHAMLLAPPSQLVGVSFLTQDPIMSPMVDDALSFHQTQAQIEEIVALRPDLVLAHSWTSPVLISSLERLGLAYKIYDSPQSLEAIPDYIRQIGVDIGQSENAEELVATFESNLERLEAMPRVDFRAATYAARGYMGGTQGLANSLLARAGFENIAGEYGLEFGGYMPLEVLLSAKPDIVLTDALYPGNSNGESLLAHPALTRLETYEIQRGQSMNCGTPHILHAYEELLKLNAELAK